MRVPDELAELMNLGLSAVIATRNERNLPALSRAVAAYLGEERDRVTVLLPTIGVDGLLANLRSNGRYALALSRPTDHRSFQLKGDCLGIREPGERDIAALQRYAAAYSAELAMVGIPTGVLQRATMWPCHALDLAVGEIFQQTPGPGAGAPIT